MSFQIHICNQLRFNVLWAQEDIQIRFNGFRVDPSRPGARLPESSFRLAFLLEICMTTYVTARKRQSHGLAASPCKGHSTLECRPLRAQASARSLAGSAVVSWGAQGTVPIDVTTSVVVPVPRNEGRSGSRPVPKLGSLPGNRMPDGGGFSSNNQCKSSFHPAPLFTTHASIGPSEILPPACRPYGW